MKARIMVLLTAFCMMFPGRFSFGASVPVPSAGGPDVQEFVISLADTGSVDLDVPYVPTHEDVVAEMLNMAGVREDDVVYDLGCGDGRIVITAAKEKGARGVGVDIDPERIRESKRNAKEMKVDDRVRFTQQDLFKTDFSEATVVTLYLLPRVNLQLRPKLLNELKPGTRIVSHDFDMDDWRPDQYAEVGNAQVYYWVVPANVNGSWYWHETNGARKEYYTLKLHQRFQEVTGTLTMGGSSMPVNDARLDGEHLQFTVIQEASGKTVPLHFDGTVKGNTIEGSLKRESDGNKESTRKWIAHRDPSTIAPLDDGDAPPNVVEGAQTL